MYVAVEGIDGSGKSTLVEALVAATQPRSVRFREPGSAALEPMIRDLLKDPDVDQRILANLFAADRYLGLRKLREVYGQDNTLDVFSDRGILSSLAYQGRTIGMDSVAIRNEGVEYPPGFIVFWDVPVDTCWGRVQRRGGSLDVFESSRGALEETREAYLQALTYPLPEHALPTRIRYTPENPDEDPGLLARDLLMYLGISFREQG